MKTLSKPNAGIGLALAASFGVAPVVTALTPVVASAEAATTVTRYTYGTTNIRSGPGTNYSKVGTVPKDTKIVGTLSNGWIKISSPSAYAGRYIGNSVLTSTPPPPAPNGLVAWAGYRSTQVLNSSGRIIGHIGAGTRLTGKLSGSYFVMNSGTYAGERVSKYDVMWTDMSRSLIGDGTKVSSKAPVGQTVTRYTVSGLDYKPAVRTRASTHSTLIARMTPGTSLEGQYVNKRWFKVTSGSYAGRYVSADLLHTTPTMAAHNGKIPVSDLCQVPSWLNTSWAPNTPRTLQCGALSSFLEMNAAFKAKFGYNLIMDEGYRDRYTQDMYYKVYGYPSAAMPGTSNHGYGRAVDLIGTRTAVLEGRGSSPFRFGSAADTWLTNNSKAYGWDRSEHLDKTGSNPEYWHYNWIG